MKSTNNKVFEGLFKKLEDWHEPTNIERIEYNINALKPHISEKLYNDLRREFKEAQMLEKLIK